MALLRSYAARFCLDSGRPRCRLAGSPAMDGGPVVWTCPDIRASIKLTQGSSETIYSSYNGQVILDVLIGSKLVQVR
jgi:hypothetical protein